MASTGGHLQPRVEEWEGIVINCRISGIVSIVVWGTILQHCMESRLDASSERMDTKPSTCTERKGHKRKLGETSLAVLPVSDRQSDPLIQNVRTQIDVLRLCTSWSECHRSASRRAAHTLAEFAKQGDIFCRGLLARSVYVRDLPFSVPFSQNRTSGVAVIYHPSSCLNLATWGWCYSWSEDVLMRLEAVVFSFCVCARLLKWVWLLSWSAQVWA